MAGLFSGAAGATPKTATGTGALPSNVPAWRPMAVWGGRTTGDDGKKSVLTLALTFYPLPRGEEMAFGRFRFCGRLSSQSRRAFFKKTARVSPSPPTGVGGEGRGEVARETNFGATPETATGTGALPSNVPVGGRARKHRPMAVWSGRTGQRTFEYRP